MAPVQAEIESYLGLGGNLFDLNQLNKIGTDAVWSEIKTRLESMTSELDIKPEDLQKIKPTELLKNKAEMQKKINNIKTQAPSLAKDLGGEALKAMATEFAKDAAQQKLNDMTAGCFAD